MSDHERWAWRPQSGPQQNAVCGANGALRVKLHDKHAALVSIGRHLGMFDDKVKVDAVYGISEEPMSAEEWKKQYVKEG
jgi:hypothetical protein